MSSFGSFVLILFLVAVAIFTSILAYCSVVDGGAAHGPDDPKSKPTG